MPHPSDPNRRDTDFTAANLARLSERLDARTVAAAWPDGSPLLALAITTCGTCDATTVCRDWLVRAPETLSGAPAFCPNAAQLRRA